MTPRTHTTGINHLLSSVASKNAIKNNHIPPNPNQPAPGKHTVVTPWVSIHFRSPDPQGRENPSIDHDPRGSNRHRPEDARLDRRLWPFFFWRISSFGRPCRPEKGRDYWAASSRSNIHFRERQIEFARKADPRNFPIRHNTHKRLQSYM